MNDLIKLSMAVSYSSSRISAEKVHLDNFISTDNMLQNKCGVITASKLPPSSNAMPK